VCVVDWRFAIEAVLPYKRNDGVRCHSGVCGCRVITTANKLETEAVSCVKCGRYPRAESGDARRLLVHKISPDTCRGLDEVGGGEGFSPPSEPVSPVLHRAFLNYFV